jgi:hypothetical protein
MSRRTHEEAAPGSAASPTVLKTDGEAPARPRRKGRTPGRKDPAFSPHQFFALTQTGSETTTGPDLWLTEEEVEVVHPKGILILGQYFYHEKLDRYVTGKTPKHKRPQVVIRYDRAMLARHVLERIDVYLKASDGVYQPLCTAELRENAMARVDHNLALAYRRRYEQILASKRTTAQEAYFGTESGAESVARLREQHAARGRQRKATAPKPSTPEPHLNARIRARISEVQEEVVATLRAEREAREAEDERSGPTAPAPTIGRKKAGKAGGSTRKRARAASHLSPDPTISQPADRTPSAGTAWSGVLPTRTGFHSETEE